MTSNETGTGSEGVRYRSTNDRTGEVMLACGECEETWPEDRIEDDRCPDCRGGRA